MNDWLEEMASDSGSSSDKLDRLEDNQLDSISRLANDASALEEMISHTEDLLKAHKESL